MITHITLINIKILNFDNQKLISNGISIIKDIKYPKESVSLSVNTITQTLHIGYKSIKQEYKLKRCKLTNELDMLVIQSDGLKLVFQQKGNQSSQILEFINSYLSPKDMRNTTNTSINTSSSKVVSTSNAISTPKMRASMQTSVRPFKSPRTIPSLPLSIKSSIPSPISKPVDIKHPYHKKQIFESRDDWIGKDSDGNQQKASSEKIQVIQRSFDLEAILAPKRPLSDNQTPTTKRNNNNNREYENLSFTNSSNGSLSKYRENVNLNTSKSYSSYIYDDNDDNDDQTNMSISLSPIPNNYYKPIIHHIEDSNIFQGVKPIHSKSSLLDCFNKIKDKNTTTSNNIRSGGIANIGNSCYIAALIQALLGLNCFAKDLMSSFWTSHLTKVSNDKFLCLRKCIQLSEKMDKMDSINLQDFKEMIDKSSNIFKGNRQQDVHEFFLELMAHIEDDMIAILKMSPKTMNTNTTSIHMINGNGNSNANTNTNGNGIGNGIGNSSGNGNGNGIGNGNANPNPMTLNTSISIQDDCNTLGNTTMETSISSEESMSMSMSMLMSQVSTERLFRCDIRSFVECLNCHQPRSPIYEPYNNFSLDLSTITSDHVQLETLIDDFFASDIRILNCSCNPKECENKVKLTRVIDRLPKILVFHLKRFQYNSLLNRTDKLQTLVSIPLSLDMTCYCDEDTIVMNSSNYYTGNQLDVEMIHQSKSNDLDTWICYDCNSLNPINKILCSTCSINSPNRNNNNTSNKKNPMNSTKYQLQSVIRHLGMETSSGHYICDRLTLDNNNNQWVQCNDAYLSNITSHQVQLDERSPYMLFYVRQ